MEWIIVVLILSVVLVKLVPWLEDKGIWIPRNKDFSNQLTKYLNRELTKNEYFHACYSNKYIVVGHACPRKVLIRFNQENKVVFLTWTTNYGYLDSDGYHVAEEWIIMEK